ncbi:MAG: hypothetical protein Q7S98_02225 [Deltaproteobacteria bacterium]|nr:hypothetical protein [Deltaproteobacteria bacterium]
MTKKQVIYQQTPLEKPESWNNTPSTGTKLLFLSFGRLSKQQRLVVVRIGSEY